MCTLTWALVAIKVFSPVAHGLWIDGFLSLSTVWLSMVSQRKRTWAAVWAGISDWICQASSTPTPSPPTPPQQAWLVNGDPPCSGKIALPRCGFYGRCAVFGGIRRCLVCSRLSPRVRAPRFLFTFDPPPPTCCSSMTPIHFSVITIHPRPPSPSPLPARLVERLGMRVFPSFCSAMLPRCMRCAGYRLISQGQT